MIIGHESSPEMRRARRPFDKLRRPDSSTGMMTEWTSGGGRREGIEVTVDRLGPAHPGFWPDAADPVGEARDETEILADMLLADQPDRHDAARGDGDRRPEEARSEEHTSELQSLMRISYAGFCLKKKKP